MVMTNGKKVSETCMMLAGWPSVCCSYLRAPERRLVKHISNWLSASDDIGVFRAGKRLAIMTWDNMTVSRRPAGLVPVENIPQPRMTNDFAVMEGNGAAAVTLISRAYCRAHLCQDHIPFWLILDPARVKKATKTNPLVDVSLRVVADQQAPQVIWLGCVDGWQIPWLCWSFHQW